MEDRYRELISTATQNQECLEDIEPLGELLPTSDKDLEELLDWLAGSNQLYAFEQIVHAALIGGRKPDVAIVRRHPSLLRNDRWLAGIVTKMGGDVLGYLLWVFSQDRRFYPGVRALALVLAMKWETSDDPRVSREFLVQGYRSLLPLLLMSPKTPKATQLSIITHVCALALAVGEPIPFEHITLTAKGKARGHDIERLKQKALEQKANECLVEYSNLVRYEPRKLLAPTRADIRAPMPTARPNRRENPKIGRNSPCPCGSGKKYKKCCASKDITDKETAQDAVTMETKGFSGGDERLLTISRIKDASASDLAKLDFTAVDSKLYPDLAKKFVDRGKFEALHRLLQITGTEGSMEEHFVSALKRAANFDEPEALRLLSSLVTEERLAGLHDCMQAKLALIDPEPAGQAALLEREFHRCLDNSVQLSDLAVNLLWWKCPSLGIIAARATLACDVAPDYAKALSRLVMQARGKIGLMSPDPSAPMAQRIFDREEEELELAEAVKELRKMVRRAEGRHEKQDSEIRAREEEITALTNALTASRQKSAADPSETASGDKKLKERLSVLKSRLTDLQQERRNLRQELEDSQERLSSQEAELEITAGDTDSSAEEALLGDAIDGSQPIRIPIFPKRFLVRLQRFPINIRRETMRVVGDMAAGYKHAWAGACKLETRPEFIRQKVKRNHRIFLKEGDGTLEVIDLVDRKDFERAIGGL